jgi:hypothetical protein
VATTKFQFTVVGVFSTAVATVPSALGTMLNREMCAGAAELTAAPELSNLVAPGQRSPGAAPAIFSDSDATADDFENTTR